MFKTFVHHGPYDAVPSDASQGLLFLKAFLPALDSLGPFSGTPELAKFVAQDATFTVGNGQPSKASEVMDMLPKRASALSKFKHDLDAAWDVELPSGSRTVMYESSSKTVFKQDKDQQEVAVKEFNIIELGAAPNGEGFGGLIVTGARTFIDASPVTERMQLLKSQ